MFTRRFKRVVSLAASVFAVGIFIFNLRRGHDVARPLGVLMGRSLNENIESTIKRHEVSIQAPLTLQAEAAMEGGEIIEDHANDGNILAVDEDGRVLELDDVEFDPDLIENDNSIPSAKATSNDGDEDEEANELYQPLPEGKDYREIFSLSSPDRKFFSIFLGGDIAYNPSLIPHPTRHDLWIIIAQREQTHQERPGEEVLLCNAGFLNGVLVCTAPPTVLPISPSVQGTCTEDLAYINFRGGPRDGRILYGPEAPYIVYGSQSLYTCLGLWIQDLRMLLNDFRLEQLTLVKLFKKPFELQRPEPIKAIEKNFFLFWDSSNKAYVHHDIYPARVFAQLSFDGSVGPNLAPSTASKDAICMAQHMPILDDSPDETIHQATNSLSITMCKRTDPYCIPSDTNTFVMTIFQHKSYHDYHSIYEPYIMLFQRNAPFAIHAISQRPFWIHGRNPLTKDSHSIHYDQHPDRAIPDGHSEMFYITSMSWKTHGQRYHGYMDDPLLLAFGIEDSRPAVMDVEAGDLLQDLGFCGRFWA